MAVEKELEKRVRCWKRFPDKFAEDYLGMQLTQYQKELLRMLSKERKTFDQNLLYTNRVRINCVESIMRAFLLPATKILIACPSVYKVDEYVKTYDSIIKYYPDFLSEQIKNMSDMVINFNNGSSIEIVTPKDSHENDKND